MPLASPNASSQTQIRLRVAYPSAQSLIAEYTSRLARRDYVLATRRSVPQGAVFVFEMYCPDHSVPVELEAKVVRARPIFGASAAYELAMQYRATREGQAAVEELLRRIDVDRSYAKVRAHPRIPVNLTAEDAAGSGGGFLVRDVSLGGMLLAFQRGGWSAPHGASVLLGARFGESDPLVFLPGTVRWSRRGAPDGHTHVGVAFTNCDAHTAAQAALLQDLTHLHRPMQMLIHLACAADLPPAAISEVARRSDVASIASSIARHELAVALDVSVVHGPLALPEQGTCCLARVGFAGDLTGELSLVASLELCAAIAERIAGDPVPIADVPVLHDGLSEFVTSLGGSFCDRLEAQGVEVSLTEPLMGEPPPRALGDLLHTFTMTGPRGSAVFRVVVRGGGPLFAVS